MIEEACQHQCISGDGLTVHADRGNAMRSKNLADLLGELGIRRSFSRPHVSNDNPYSESKFKTLKYHPVYPECFGRGGSGAPRPITFCKAPGEANR